MSHIAVAIARFDDEAPFVRARSHARDRGLRVLGEWCPFPPSSLPEHYQARAVVWTVAVAGIVGALAFFVLEWWTAYDYPFNSGGRPLFSWQVFIVPATEFLALSGAVGGVIALFVAARLTRLNHPAFDFEEVMHASRDSFVLALACDTDDSANSAMALLADAGATHSRLVEA
ncbi:DUF3341 domain-containing protein [Stakelama saccharophila]|uniref:DUF3341 domain-containing protein n=1 Tax=Stakelama saccharophila TaxID=3075605 RepID=A0ABZ0B5P3_9SPHN|nr:DUF3341 domain-containing protein [Stakelama sp. W311]WNO52716.1 DUF3341 domain-containing protein [Stakelama sp. W311]